MIELIRSAASSFAAKLLLGLLVLSFAVWGVGDWLRAGQPTTVATVDDKEVDVYAYRRAFQDQMRNFRGQLNLQTARAIGLDQMVLGSLLRQTALDLETAELGISTPDARIAEFIRTSPAFAAPGGAFEPTRYDFALAQLGMRKQEFEDQVRRELARALLVRGVAAGGQSARIAAEKIWMRANETRDLSYVLISPDAVAAPDAPNEEALAKYHQAEKERFTRPELRTLRLLWLRAADRADPAQVSDDQAKARYEERSGEFNRPERRNLEQIVYDTEDEAKAAAARLKNGEAFAKLAEERKLSADDVALGYLAKADLQGLQPAVANAAFGETKSGAIGPVKTPSGWAVINIRGVIPATETPFEDAKAELAKELAEEAARRGLADVANGIEDLRAAGASFDEVADKEKVTLRTITIDANGMGADGKPVADLPGGPALLKKAFELESGEEMDLTELPNQEFYALELEKIEPAALRPLEDVREKVEAAWIAAERRKAAEAKAKALVESVEGGASLAEAAQEAGLEVVAAEGLGRTARRAPLPAELIRDAFGAEVGAPLRAAVAPAQGGDEAKAGSQIVAVTTQIHTADPAKGDAAIQAQKGAAAQSVASDLAELFAGAALADRSISTNPAAVEAAINSLNGGR